MCLKLNWHSQSVYNNFLHRELHVSQNINILSKILFFWAQKFILYCACIVYGFFCLLFVIFFFLLYCSFTSVGGFSSWNPKWVCFQLSYEPLKVIRMKLNVHIDFGQMLSLVDYLRNLKCCHFTLLGAAGQFSKVVILSSYQSIRTKIWEANYSLISRHMEHES